MEDYRLDQSGQEVQDILNGAAMQVDLTAETERATEAEQTLQDNIDAEETRAQGAEGTLQNNIDAEEARAKAAEKQNADDIDAIEEKIPSGASSSNKLATEEYVNDSVATATATFRGSYNLVSDLHLTVNATEQQIAAALAGAISTADNNDYCFILVPTSSETPTEIKEIDRYKFNGTVWGFEYKLNNSGFTAAQWAAINSGITSGDVAKLAALPTNAQLTTLLAGLQSDIDGEEARAKGAEGTLQDNIDAEETRAKAAEKQNADDIDAIEAVLPESASSENKVATESEINSLSAAIEAILLLIPSAATSLNKLADKAFVNSSIATATATFRGTYNLVNDLGLTTSATHAQIATALAGAILTADNNDYAFVQIPTSDAMPTEIAKTERYKFNGTAWEYEYDLNNSGFTADQWAAINSGITQALVTKLSALPTNAELTTELGTLTSGITTINQKIPNAASQANKLVDTAAMESYIVQVLDVLTASFNVTSTDGHVTVQISQVDGKITSVSVSTSDIASAADLNLKASQADLTALASRVTTAEGNITTLGGRMTTAEGNITTLGGRMTTAEGNITSLGGRVSTNEADIAALQALYNALQQSKPIPVDALPETGQQQGVIYRLAGTTSYSDYMWNGSTWVLMATYDNAIDPRPKKASQNLVTSGGVFDNMGALDVSELNATENPHTLAQYTDLSAALAAIPTDYQKGGMTIKFVQSSDNKYVQYRLMSQNFSTIESDWQGVDDELTPGSENLAKSGGVRKYIEELRQLLNITGVKEVLANTYSAGYYSGSVGGTISDNTNNGKKYAPVSIPANSSGKKVFIAVYNHSSGSSRIGAITNSSDVILQRYVENSPLFVNNDIAYYTMDISDDASKLYISVNSSAIVLYAIVADSYNIKEIQNSIQRNNSNIQSNTSDITELKAELQIPLGQNTVASIIGTDYNNEVTVSIPKNTTFIIKTTGTSNLNNYYLTINGTNTEAKSGDATLERTYDYDVTSIKIWRSGSNVIAAGDISLSVLPKSDNKSIVLNQMNNLIEQNKSDIGIIEAEIEGIYNGIKVEAVLNDLIHLDSGYYYNYNSVTPVQHSGKYTKPENVLDISEYTGKFIRITYAGCSNSSSRSCLVTDTNDNILTYAIESEFINNEDGTYYYDLEIPISAKKLYISFSNDVISYNFVVASVIKPNLVYVDAENGSDDNNGEEGNPLATFNKALKITGQDTTIIFSGETEEAINIKTKSGQRSLTIIGKYGHINRINKGRKLEDITLYSAGIYQASVSNYSDGQVLFQHDVNDVQTLIDDNERLPQQRGMEYRCEHTRLIQKSSLSALEESQEYAYYYSSAESKIYFKPASTDFINHPIIIPSTSYGIGGNDGSVKVEVVNVEFLYCYANFDKCHGAVIKDCKAGYCNSGAGFRYNLSVGITFEKCEAVRVKSGGTGDGFNAHANINSTEFGNAPVFSKHVTATIIDCWSHDNNDDGYSDHERSETVIRGGLFEYNGKAGITPSYGSHCSCYNVISRKNFRGFYYTGNVSDVTPPEGGKYGQMLCINCIADSNTNDAGFSVQGAGNRMILKDCLSINHTNGYFADSGTNALLYNCKGLDNTNATAGSGTITIKNGSEIV